MKKKFRILPMLVVFLFLTTSAYADYFFVSLTSGSNTVQVYDNASEDLATAVGQITFLGAVDEVWTYNVTTGMTYPILGNKANPQIDLNTVDVSSTAGGTLTVVAEAVGFDALTIAKSFACEVGGTTEGSVQYKVFSIDEYNSYTLIGDSGVIDPSSVAFSSIFDGAVASGAVGYKIEATIIHAEKGITSFDAAFSVPEPGSLMLLGFGMLGVLGFSRKKH